MSTRRLLDPSVWDPYHVVTEHRNGLLGELIIAAAAESAGRGRAFVRHVEETWGVGHIADDAPYERSATR